MANTCPRGIGDGQKARFIRSFFKADELLGDIFDEPAQMVDCGTFGLHVHGREVNGRVQPILQVCSVDPVECDTKIALHILINGHESAPYYGDALVTLLEGQEMSEIYRVQKTVHMKTPISLHCTVYIVELHQFTRNLHFDGSYEADALIVCEDKEFAVSRSCMAIWSPWFKTYFEAFPHDNLITFEAMARDELEAFLSLTNGCSMVNVDWHNAYYLLVAADVLSSDTVTWLVEDFLVLATREAVNKDNISEKLLLLRASDQYGLTRLEYQLLMGFKKANGLLDKALADEIFPSLSDSQKEAIQRFRHVHLHVAEKKRQKNKEMRVRASGGGDEEVLGSQKKQIPSIHDDIESSPNCTTIVIEEDVRTAIQLLPQVHYQQSESCCKKLCKPCCF